MTNTQVSHDDSLTNDHHYDEEIYMQDEPDEIEMYEHVEEPEEPTNGLDEIIDWDRLEKALDNDEFSSKSAFCREVKKHFEEAGAVFTRKRHRMAMKGLFPEYRVLYDALPIHAVGDRVAA